MDNAPLKNLGLAFASLVAPRNHADRVILAYGLHAQRRLLAYMVGFVGIGAPIFLWTAHFSIKGWPYLVYFGLIFFNATAFYWLANKSPFVDDPAEDGFYAQHLKEILWRQGLGAGLWTVSLLVICLSAAAIGQMPELVLMICAGGAAGIIFFAAPVQTFLLTLGPIAIAGPIIAMRYVAPHSESTSLISAGLIMALAMGFVINRHLTEHYGLLQKQRQLNLERIRAQKSTDILHQSRAALLDTLSRDVQSGLEALEANLIHGLSYLGRAPAPRNEVNTALNEVTRLKELIATTLDNEILESGKLSVENKPFDLETILTEKYTYFAPLAHARGLSLSFDNKTLPSFGAAFGDEQRVRQILNHLIKNAIDYSTRGNIDIRVETFQSVLRIAVIDTGLGLSADELKEVFLPYRRIKRTCAGHGGAGLGLSLSKALAELMEAQLGAESTRDVGSKFWLDLRFDPAAEAPKPQAAAPSDTRETPPQRVLLLSNDSLRAAQLRQWLEGQGHLCLLSTKVARAHSLVQKSPFDAVVISHDATDEVSHLIDDITAANSETHTRIIALLNDETHCQTLADKGVSSLLWPTTNAALSKAMRSI
jgi:signal transduction histidine kinase